MLAVYRLCRVVFVSVVCFFSSRRRHTRCALVTGVQTCALPISKGVITAATAPDHIVPLALGGSDDDSNVRCLCPECHLERTREQFGHRARSTIGEDGWP